MSKAKNSSEPIIGSETEERVTSMASEKASKKEQVQTDQGLSEQQRQTVAEIGQIHGELCEATRLTAQKAAELGERLTKLKTAVGHGNWLPFVRKHLPFTDQTAGRYMKVYKKRAVLAQKFDSLSNFRVSEAYEALTRPKTNSEAKRQEAINDPPTNTDATREPAEILTEIQRSVADRLERLPRVLLVEFESDFRSFLERWIQEHKQEVQK